MFLRLNPRDTQVRPFSYWWAPQVSVDYPSSSPFPSDVALEQQHCSVRGGGGEGHALGRIGGVRVSKENKRDEEEGGMSMTSGSPLSGFQFCPFVFYYSKIVSKPTSWAQNVGST
jgi:hypothetical protein